MPIVSENNNPTADSINDAERKFRDAPRADSIPEDDYVQNTTPVDLDATLKSVVSGSFMTSTPGIYDIVVSCLGDYVGKLDDVVLEINGVNVFPITSGFVDLNSLNLLFHLWFETGTHTVNMKVKLAGSDTATVRFASINFKRTARVSVG